jgi:hypothetical protein
MSAVGPDTLTTSDESIEGDLTPGRYVLSPSGLLADGGSANSWSCSSLDVITLAAGATVTCELGTVSFQVPPSSSAPSVPTTVPQGGLGQTCLTEQTADPCTSESTLPPRWSNIRENSDTRTTQQFIEDASVEATIGVRFDGVPAEEMPELVEDKEVPMTVELTVVGSGEEPLPPGVSSNDTTLITYQNRVTVTCEEQANGGNPADCADFDVTSLNPLKQDLPELNFEFSFTPRRTGQINVLVIVDGLLYTENLETIPSDVWNLTKEIPITVNVSPERKTWDTLLAAVKEPAAGWLVTSAPDQATRETPVKVTSNFTYPGGLEQHDGIDIVLHLDTDGDATVLPAEVNDTGTAAEGTWTVIPHESGPLELNFWFEATTDLADVGAFASDPQPVVLTVVEPRAPAPSALGQATKTAGSVWDGVVRIAGGFATVLAACAAAFGVVKQRRKTRTAAVTSSASGTVDTPET